VILPGAGRRAIAGSCTCASARPSPLYGSERVLGVLKAIRSSRAVAESACARGGAARPAVRAAHVDGSAQRLEVELFDVPGKVALYLETGVAADALAAAGDTVGVESRGGKRLLYIPAAHG
jgi:pyrroloquinoline quinone biosynthesis protein B